MYVGDGIDSTVATTSDKIIHCLPPSMYADAFNTLCYPTSDLWVTILLPILGVKLQPIYSFYSLASYPQPTIVTMEASPIHTGRPNTSQFTTCCLRWIVIRLDGYGAGELVCEVIVDSGLGNLPTISTRQLVKQDAWSHTEYYCLIGCRCCIVKYCSIIVSYRRIRWGWW